MIDCPIRDYSEYPFEMRILFGYPASFPVQRNKWYNPQPVKRGGTWPD